MNIDTNPLRSLIDAVAFAIPASVPTTEKAREIAVRVVEIVLGAVAPAPPSAPVGVELSALRVQEWLYREHDILCPVQEIERAMRMPLAQQPMD